MLLAEGFLRIYPWLPGAVIAAAGLLLNWLYRRRDRKTKTLDYRVLSDVAILSHRPDDNQLKVTYMDEEIDNPRLVRVRFTNTGTEVIRASEILEQYVLTVHDAWMVSAQMTEQTADNLATFEATCEPGKHGILMTLATLNSGDNFTLQMIVDSETRAEITVSGRIEGETRKTGIQPSKAELKEARDFAVIAVLFLGLFGGIGLPLILFAPATGVRAFGFVSMAVGLSVFTWVSSLGFHARGRIAQRMEKPPHD